MATMLIGRRRHCRIGAGAATTQKGEILLLTLVALLVCLLAFVYASRQTIIDSQVIGNNLAQQKDVQIADIALRIVQNQILTAYGGRPLELSATNQAWWRDVAPGTAAPDTAYWAGCLGNSNSTQRCSQIVLQAGSQELRYTVLAVVQATGRSDNSTCSLSQFQAVYYDIHLSVMEASGASRAATETVYKVCTDS